MEPQQVILQLEESADGWAAFRAVPMASVQQLGGALLGIGIDLKIGPLAQSDLEKWSW